jgi:hypothetical protein
MTDEPIDLSKTRHQSVRDYVAARQRGDNATCDRIVAEVRARYDTRTTDGTELGEMVEASMTVPFNGTRR